MNKNWLRLLLSPWFSAAQERVGLVVAKETQEKAFLGPRNCPRSSGLGSAHTLPGCVRALDTMSAAGHSPVAQGQLAPPGITLSGRPFWLHSAVLTFLPCVLHFPAGSTSPVSVPQEALQFPLGHLPHSLSGDPSLLSASLGCPQN